MKLRTVLIAIVAVVLLAVGAIAVLLGSINSFRPKIQAELEQKLNRPVTVGQLSLKIVPLEIKVDGLTIAEGPGFPLDKPFATAGTVFVSANLASLLKGSPEIKKIVLTKPQIELIRNEAGTWNFSSLGKGNNGGADSTFSLASLSIVDGQIGFTDQQKKQPRSVYDHIDLKLSDFAPGKQFGLNLGVHFPGKGRQMIEFGGKAGPLNTPTENALPPVTGKLSIEQVSLSAMNRFASGTIPADTDSVVSGDADLNSLADVLTCKGTLELQNTILNGAKMDYPIKATYDIEDDLKQKKLLLRSGVVNLGPTSFTTSGSVESGPASALLNLNLKTGNSSITELAKLAGAFGVGFNPAYKVGGRVSADVTAKGPANAPVLSGSITARDLAASGGEIKQPVSIPEIDLTLTPDSIISNTFTARSGGTALAMAFTLAQYGTKSSAIDATVKTASANISELLNIAKAYGVDAAKGVSGSGTASLDVHLKGPTANPSAVAYAGTASISAATFTTPDLKKPVSIGSANAKFSQNSVGFDSLVATIGGTSLRGSLSARNFAAPDITFSLAADKIDTKELQNLTNTPSQSSADARSAAQKPSLFRLTTGSGNLSAGEIVADDIVLKNVNAKCKLDKGVVDLAPLSTEIFGGKASGSLTADMRNKTPVCALKMKVAGADANNLLSAMSSMKDRIFGKLAADTNLRFSLADGNELARTLNGTLSFNLTDGIIKNLNIINEVEKIGKFLKSAGRDSAASGGGTALKTFSGTLNILNGVASTDNLTGVLNSGSMSSKGTLNLATQDVNMHVTAILGNQVSQSVGGTGIGGYLSTVLGNAKGELIVPLFVTGNMAKPMVSPDAGAMAQMKLKGLIPGGDPARGTAGGAQKGIGGILGGILGGQKPQQSPEDAKANPQQQPNNPFGSILDQFKKKKPQPEQKPQ